MSKVYLYESNEIFFNTRGLGVLTDIADAIIYEEINGLYDLTFFYPIDGKNFNSISEGRIIRAKNKKGYQAFRIDSISKSDELMGIVVHAYHISYDLSFNFIEDTFIQDKGGDGAIKQLLNKAIIPHNFTGMSNIQTTFSARIVRRNVLSALMGDFENSFISRAGGEFERDNFTINWKNSIGIDRGVKIKYRKNLTGLEFNSDESEVITKIMPQGFNGLLLPEKYVDSPLIDQYHMPKIKKIDFPGIISKELNPEYEEALSHELALNKLRQAAQEEFKKGIDKPNLSCEVSFVDLSQTEEYKDYKHLQEIYIGDLISVEHYRLNVNVILKMTNYRYDPINDRYISIALGEIDQVFFNAVNKADKAISSLGTLKETLQESIIERAREVSTNLINNGFGGYVRRYPDKTLIMDTDDETTATNVWQFNKNGIGYSKTGINGPYNYAWTMDGWLNTDFIGANSITANKLSADVGQNLDLSSNESITLSVKSTTQSYIDANKEQLRGPQGIQGIEGVGILNTTITYAQSTSGTTRPTSGWTTTIPSVPAGSYLWTKFVWTYTDGTAETGYSVAKMGSTGPKGATGAPGISSYTHIAYATNSTGTSGFSVSDSAGKTYIGVYVDSSPTDSTTPSKYKWTLIKGQKGDQGVPGQKGADGRTPYFHVAYANNATGTSGFSTTDPTGRPYIGTYTDYTQADSTDPTKYKWRKYQGSDGRDNNIFAGEQAPPDITMLWFDTKNKQFKEHINGKWEEIPYTSIEETLQNLDVNISNLNTEISAVEGKIESQVSELTVTKDEITELKSTVTSTTSNFTLQFDQYRQQLEENAHEIEKITGIITSKLDENGHTVTEWRATQDVNAFARFGTNGIALMSAGSETFKVEDGVATAKSLYVTEEIGFGNHTARSYGDSFTIFTWNGA